MTQTVDQYMGDDDETGLVDCGPESYGLRLVRQADGRIDLCDQNCANTGSDLRGTPAVELVREVVEWLKCTEYRGALPQSLDDLPWSWIDDNEEFEASERNNL